MPGEEIAETLSLKSQCFEAVRDGSDIVFTSYGYGSGLGLSQYGAYLEAQSGKNFKEILFIISARSNLRYKFDR